MYVEGIPSQTFSQLSRTWKILVVIGIVSIVIVLFLIIFIIMIFKTEMIPLEMFIDSKVDLDEFDDFFKKLDSDDVDISQKVDEFLNDTSSESSSENGTEKNGIDNGINDINDINDIDDIDVNYLLKQNRNIWKKSI